MNFSSLRAGGFSLLFFLLCMTAHAQSPATNTDLKIWFNRPATEWNEALPVGNGHLGAMIFGGIDHERLQLNEETVWTGKDTDFVNPGAKAALPEVRKLLFAGKYAEAQKLAQEKMMGDKKVHSTYQTLGDLYLTFANGSQRNISEYRRELDLTKAVAKVSYRANGVLFTREVFTSAPDKALIIRLTADRPSALSFAVDINRPGDKALVEAKENQLLLSEHVGNGIGVKMMARVKVVNEGGNIKTDSKTIHIEGASTVTLLLTAATDYWGKDPSATSQQQLNTVSKKNYDAVKADHINDYQNYFNRVDFHIGTSDAVYFPTDARLSALQLGNNDPQLTALYFQFGRYLLISSSRPGGLPANLQGIWADGLYPPWDADYHININIQMNYWLSEVTNLSELHLPFLAYLDKMRTDARKTAQDMYGIKGTVAHFTSDAWFFTEPYGQTQWAMWPMGMAWCARHPWEHYLYTSDKKYLQESGYPVMKEAATFCMNWLVKNPVSGKLVSGPSISPENTFKTKEGEVATMVMGPTMDHMIIRDLMNNTIAASKVLDTDAAFRKQLEKTVAKLAPTQITSDGRIMEWTEEFEEPEPGHRHISQLFGLHPGKEITQQKNPSLMAAARKTIDHRLAHGGGHTGWSRAWIINFFARLQDGEAAYSNLVALLKKSTLPNLYDNHPPFQIDGNFGAPAGIAEMLMQSHDDEIQLLPALPSAWPKGYIHGLCVRGSFEVNIDWENGKLKAASILSKEGNPAKVRYKDKVITLPTEKGKRYKLSGELVVLAD